MLEVFDELARALRLLLDLRGDRSTASIYPPPRSASTWWLQPAHARHVWDRWVGPLPCVAWVCWQPLGCLRGGQASVATILSRPILSRPPLQFRGVKVSRERCGDAPCAGGSKITERRSPSVASHGSAANVPSSRMGMSTRERREGVTHSTQLAPPTRLARRVWRRPLRSSL